MTINIKRNVLDVTINVDVIRKIGEEEGLNSEVFLVRDRQLEEFLILKKISKKSLINQNISDFFVEAQMLNECNHPNVMPIRYAGDTDEYISYTMPFFSKGSLASITKDKPLTVQKILEYSLDFLNGLLFIHIKGLLHLDIKPTNIMIDDSDRGVITDFGLAKYVNNSGFAKQPLQYVRHRSPETYITEERTVQDDIYQTGLTLYRLCNGDKDFHEQFQKLIDSGQKPQDFISKSIFPNRKNYLPHIPKKLRSIVNKALEVNPNKRYKSVLNLINEISLIEEFVNWQVEIKQNKYTWTYTDGKINYEVILFLDGNQWRSQGVRKNLETKKQTNISKYSHSYNSEIEAFKKLDSLLKNI